MPAPKADFQTIVDQAVKVLQKHAPPTGLTDDQAIDQFYKIFESPACWKPAAKGTVKDSSAPVALSAKGTKKRF
jgi:hypothetical protein